MAQLRADLLAGRANCTGIVDAYIQRIKAYDGTTGLNAVRALAPGTRARAAELDRRLAAALAAGTQASLPPLFCVPLLVKDNIDVAGLPTTAGSVALANNTRAVDATAVARLQAAGAVVLAKANMAEWALSPRVSVSSLGGAVRNAYDADRTPGGSSGGSAAGVAASFAAASLGTDTGNSVRGPASHAGLVGVRPSFGLVPRTGVVPLDLTSDTVGPLARTVGDAAALLDAMAGLPSIGIWIALAAFSLGVEIGHQAVVLPLFGLLTWVGRDRRATARQSFTRYGSLAILIGGLYFLFVAFRIRFSNQ